MKQILCYISICVLSLPAMSQGLFQSETNTGSAMASDAKAKVAEPLAVAPPEGSVPKDLLQLGSGAYYSNRAIVVDKKNRTLTLWQQQNDEFKLLKAYPIDYGKKDGDKFFLGDLKTPEGTYFFTTAYSGKQIDYNEYGKRAFVTDYPNFWDRRERKTGSGIWLHAIPETKTLRRGSRGCVVLRNEAIEEIKEFVSMQNMPFIVKNEVKYVKAKDAINTNKEVQAWLSDWIQAWQSKNVDNYITHYSEDFRAQGMNKKRWKKYKTNLNKKYDFIQVKANEPMIVQHENEITIRFLQDYRSSTHGDFGEKVLYVKKQEGKYQIVHEKWNAISQDLVAALKKGKKRNTANSEPL